MGHVVNTHMVDVSPEHLAPQRAVLRGKAGGLGEILEVGWRVGGEKGARRPTIEQ